MRPLADLAAVLLVGLAATAHAEAPNPDSTQEPAAADRAAEEKARGWFTDTRLVTQDGREVRFYSDVLRGKVVAVNFMFTRCTGACPLATARLNRVRAELGERFGRDVQFVSISLDPADTPADLAAFAERNRARAPGWTFLTGRREDVALVAKRLGQWVEDPGDHSTLLIAGNVRRRHWTKLRPDLTPEAVAAELRRLAGER